MPVPIAPHGHSIRPDPTIMSEALATCFSLPKDGGLPFDDLMAQLDQIEAEEPIAPHGTD